MLAANLELAAQYSHTSFRTCSVVYAHMPGGRTVPVFPRQEQLNEVTMKTCPREGSGARLPALLFRILSGPCAA